MTEHPTPPFVDVQEQPDVFVEPNLNPEDVDLSDLTATDDDNPEEG